MQNKHPYLLAVDWLSYSAYGCPQDVTIFSHYKLVDLDKSTQVFKHLAAIVDTHSNEQVATIQYEPRSSALKRMLCIVKISNRMLYESDFAQLVSDINQGLNLEFNAISRVDICADFYHFLRYHPHQLIKDFLYHKLRRYGKSNYNLRGDQDKGENCEYEYLRFGAATSNIISYLYNKSEELRVTSANKGLEEIKRQLKEEKKKADTDNIACYLYNKSEELRAVKSKPYISKRWAMLAEDYPDHLTERPDVWRLEFRVTAKNIQSVDTESAELVGISVDTLQDPNTLQALFAGLVSRHWRWAKEDKTKSRFCDLVEIPMFDLEKGHVDLLHEKRANTERQSIHRSTLTFIKHFMRLSDICHLPQDAYIDLENRLSAYFPIQYNAAKEWAKKQGFRNETDTF